MHLRSERKFLPYVPTCTSGVSGGNELGSEHMHLWSERMFLPYVPTCTSGVSGGNEL
jgi:hypothetical protein